MLAKLIRDAGSIEDLSRETVAAARACAKLAAAKAEAGESGREVGALMSPVVALNSKQMDTMAKLAQLEQAAEGVATSRHEVTISAEDAEAARKIAERADSVPANFLEGPSGDE